jgi:hypothetical protein
MFGEDEDKVPMDWYSILTGSIAAAIIFAIVAAGFWVTGLSIRLF